jgi:CRISPR-associated protein Cas2
MATISTKQNAPSKNKKGIFKPFFNKFKMKILITYDIQDTKKRNKITALLESYGVRVNYSVFELEISKQKLNTLLKKLKNLAKDYDSIRVYFFNKDTANKSFELFNRPNPFEKESFYVE